MTPGCSVAGCERAHYGRGWCKYHYRRWFDHGDPLWQRPTAEERATPEVMRQRILNRVEISSSGCWEWTGCISRGGYGQMTVANRSCKAHRVAYEAWIAPIPAGLEIDHLCRVRRCVNPSHLEPVDRRTNFLRGFSPSAIAVRRNHCAKGHEFTPENTNLRRTKSGRTVRECRTCKAAYMAEYGPAWRRRRTEREHTLATDEQRRTERERAQVAAIAERLRRREVLAECEFFDIEAATLGESRCERA